MAIRGRVSVLCFPSPYGLRKRQQQQWNYALELISPANLYRSRNRKRRPVACRFSGRDAVLGKYRGKAALRIRGRLERTVLQRLRLHVAERALPAESLELLHGHR